MAFGASWSSRIAQVADMVKIGKAVSYFGGACKRSCKEGGVVSVKKKRKTSAMMPWSVVIWSLVLFHVLNCCDWVLAGNEHSMMGTEGMS